MNWRSKHFTGLVAVFVFTFTVIGCGDSSSDPTVSKGELIKQADAVCKQAEGKKKDQLEAFQLNVQSEVARGKKPSELKTIEHAMGIVVPIFRTEANELNALDSPEAAKAIFDEFDEVVTEAEANPLPLANTKNDPLAGVAKKAKAYGFKTCLLYY
jgi:hypothetical protein